MNNKIIFLFSFLVIISMLSSTSILAFSVGVSPNKLELEIDRNISINSNEIILFNTNNYNIEFSIETCNNSLFDYPVKGIIHNNSYRVLPVRYKNNITNISNCTIDVVFSKNKYKTAFSVKVLTKDEIRANISKDTNSNQNKILGQFWNRDVMNESKKVNHEESYTFIIISSVVFIIMLAFIIIKKM